MKAAPRATATSDVTRPRTLLLASLGAAVGAAAILAAGASPLANDEPMARPHAIAKVACAKCHEAPADAKTEDAKEAFASAGACKSCHAQHASMRPAHRALAARGELRCATCHPPHQGAQGVSFAADGTWVRLGAGAETAPSPGALHAKATVPLVSLAACAKCHDPTSARDPIAACVSADVRADASRPLAKTPSLCFDEHKALVSTDPKTKAGPRFVAWEAARGVAVKTPWVSAASAGGAPWAPLGGAFAGATALGLVATALERRRRKPAQAAPVTPTVPSQKKKLPIVDTSTCLGCYACVDACPFDVLQIEKYVAVVARPEECCGVVLCEQVCPNGSLKIDEGEPVLDRARVDDHLESADVPGLYLAGDLTGLPLIKNAINQGVRVVDRIAATLPRRRKHAIDVLVVGAGPAGLSAALRAKEKGLACVVLEQGTIAASIKSFPRDKVVYDPPLDLPVEGELWLAEATKEELLAQWTRIVRARALDVREGLRVTSIERDADGFVVAAGDAIFHASRVIVAIGRRGTPRKLELDVEPAAEDRIAYALADARSFAGKRVVIVGLGDAAMEAAIALAHQPDTTVTIVYRGEGFRRGKSRNVKELQDLVGKGRVRLLFEMVPVAMTRSAVTLAGAVAGKGRRTVQADALFVLIGGVPSWDLLGRAGVRRGLADRSSD